MPDITETIEIVAPVAAVWAVLADFESVARWAPNVDHSSLTTPQPAGVGAGRRVQVGRNALLEVVITWEPEQTLAYELTGLPPIVRSVVNEWRLEPTGANATTVSLTSRIEAGPRPPQKLAARAFGRVLARSSRTLLDGLRDEAERAATRNGAT